MRILLAFLSLMVSAVCSAQGAPSCPVTSGTLTLKVTQPRTSAISPALLFFDATTTTDSATLPGGNNTFQDVYYAWDFGDSGISGGTNKWTTGANGLQFKNRATGPVAAHLYVLPTNATVNATNTVQVWAYDGTNIATCTVSVTIFAPSGANGFPGVSTFCVFNSTIGGGCPAGAATVTASTLSAGLAAFASGRRALFKCGDTFTGNFLIASGFHNATIGAYGGCENTSTNRPIFSNSSGSPGLNLTASHQIDIRITDIDFEGASVQSASAIDTLSSLSQVQITIYNDLCHNYQQCYYMDQPTQSGVIQSSMTNMPATRTNGVQGVYINYFGWTCFNQSSALNCAGGSATSDCPIDPSNGGVFCDQRYNALIGNFFDGTGAADNTSPNGSEVVRGNYRYSVIENNTIQNANFIGGLLKMISINARGGFTFIGEYSEDVVLTDNLFTGKSGIFPVGIGPTNGGGTDDERARFFLFERNLTFAGPCPCNGTTTFTGATQWNIGAANSTLRNNVTSTPASDGFSSGMAFDFVISAISNLPAWPITGVEVYNNTSYALTGKTAGVLLGATSNDFGPPVNSFAQNNFLYNNGTAGTNVACTGGTTNGVNNTGTGNTLCNNGVSTHTTDFRSATPTVYTDFKAIANNTGASSTIPNYFDGEGLSWTGAYRLGAFSPAAP